MLIPWPFPSGNTIFFGTKLNTFFLSPLKLYFPIKAKTKKNKNWNSNEISNVPTRFINLNCFFINHIDKDVIKVYLLLKT